MRTFSRHWYRVLMLAALFATFWPAGATAAPILYNAVARSSAAINKDAVENRLGLYGAGQIVVVGAAGFSTGDEATLRQDFRGRIYEGSWGSGVMDGAATTPQYFPQSPAASYLLTGTVTDANTGWALYASLEIEPDGYPPFTVWTDPWTGVYSVTLTGNSTHTLTVAPWEGIPGYVGQSRQVNLSADTYNENFALAADAAACTAPGYQFAPPFFAETFDSVTAPAIPAGWEVVDVNGTDGNWATRTSTVPPHSSPNSAYFNSAIVEWGHSTRLQRTQGVNLSAVSAAQVTLWMYHETSWLNDDRVQVQVSIDSGTTWNNVGSAISRYDGSTGWKEHTVALSTYTGAGMIDVRVGFLGIGAGGYNMHIDDIQVVSPACNVPTGGGLIAGSVYDHNTNAALTGATVSNEDGYARTTAATPGDPTINDGFYVLYSPAGSKTFTATLSGYTPAVADGVPVADGRTGRQDFFLSAGHIVVAPASLSTWLRPGGSTAKSFTLTNDGGATAVFTVTESVFTFPDTIQDGGFELGTPNPHWSEYSSGGRDLITTHRPRTGSYGVLMGVGYNEITGLAQTLTIPQGAATLRFWLAMGIEVGGSPDADDWMQVYLDGNSLFTVNGSQYASYFSYTEVTVDVSAYADGGSHQLRFNSYNDSATYSRFFVDDVSLIAVSPTIPWLSEAPTTGSLAASGGAQTVQATFDATGLTAGTYTGTLNVESDTPYSPLDMPVRLTVGAEFISQQTGNWSGGAWASGTPSANDWVTVTTGHTVTVDSTAAACYGLTIMPGSALVIPAGNTLTATIVVNQGTLRQTKSIPGTGDVDFHLRDSGGAVSYYGLLFEAMGYNMGNTTVDVHGAVINGTGTLNQTVGRWFDITPQFSLSDIPTTFYYADGELNGNTAGTLDVYHYRGSGQWDKMDTLARGGSGAARSITAEIGPDFSPFVLKSPDAPTAMRTNGISAVSGGVLAFGVGLLALGGAAALFKRKRP